MLLKRHLQRNPHLERPCSSTNTKTDRNEHIGKKNKNHASSVTSHASCVICHMSFVMCCVSPVNCRMYLTPTAAVTDPHPANSPTMHSKAGSQ